MSTTSTPAPAIPAKPFYLEGNFAPVDDELTATDLEVSAGELPRELTGVFLRNGPNPKGAPMGHWLVGDGMVHGVRLEAGRARWYRNRWVRTARLEGRAVAGIRGGGASNTHVIAHAGRILSCIETALPMELGPELDTLGPCDFGGVDTAFTAHGKICPLTGELVAFGYQWKSPHLTLYRIDRAGRLAERRAIEVSGPSYLHDFGITERYAIFFDSPARMVADWGGGRMPFAWEEGRPTRIGVVARDRAKGGDEVRWFEAPPCELSHTLNAFERDGRIVFDAAFGDRLHEPRTFRRFELDLARGTATGKAIDRRIVDFPRVDERRIGRPYRYGYGVELPAFGDPDPTRGASLRRYDLESGTSVATAFGDRYVLGEGVFAPRPAGDAEDDGWLLAFRYDRERKASDLVVLDAHDLAASPVAVVAMPRRVPSGIHASWVADDLP